MSDEEQSLIEGARSDRQAFGELYDRYYSRIFGYTLRRTANLQLAQDITSIVFLKAMESIGRYRWRGIPFSAWLYRIASNEIADSFRSKSYRKEKPVPDVDLADSKSCPAEEIERAEQELARHEDFLFVHECVSRLPAKYQEVVSLRYFEQMPLKEIGLVLGKSEGTVKSLLHRALSRLKKIMQ